MRLTIVTVALVAVVLGFEADAVWGQAKEPSFQDKTVSDMANR